jgi:hypothetical protein
VSDDERKKFLIGMVTADCNTYVEFQEEHFAL